VLTAIGLPTVDSFFNSLSCVSNIGLEADTAHIGGFSAMPDIAKWILSLLMLTGRLEIFTVLILFTPAFWTK
jgi:trk system potassium uptake protein TrkH